MNVILAPEPTTKEGVRRLGRYVSDLVEDFLSFYKLFCPYLQAFAHDDEDDRESLFAEIEKTVASLEEKLVRTASELLGWTDPKRILHGMYRVTGTTFKLLSWKTVTLLVGLSYLLPYIDQAVSGTYMKSLIQTAESSGYTVPTELFTYRSENLFGLRGYMNSAYAYYATVPSPTSYLPESVQTYLPGFLAPTAQAMPNPWVQTGINGLFNVALYAGYISRALSALLSSSVSFLCTQVFMKMGFSSFAGGIAGNVASYLICARLIVTVPTLWKWYKKYDSSAEYRSTLKMLEDNYIEFNQRAYDAVKRSITL